MQKTGRHFPALLLANLLLFVVLLVLLFGVLPPHWRTTESAAITQSRPDGGMQSATVTAFTPNPKFMQALNARPHLGQGQVNALYLEQQLSEISAQYLREYGFDTEIQLTKQAVSAQDFCYTVSGAPNGAVWEVWVVCDRDAQPRIFVSEQEVRQ